MNTNIEQQIQDGEMGSPVPADFFPCSICGMMYGSTYTRKRHMKNMHGNENRERLSTITCPGCPDLFDSNIQLARHCHEKHNDDGVDFTITGKEFSILDMFERVNGDVTGRQSRSIKKHKEMLPFYSGKEGLIIEEDGQWKVASRTRNGVHYTVTIRDSACECDDEDKQRPELDMVKVVVRNLLASLPKKDAVESLKKCSILQGMGALPKSKPIDRQYKRVVLECNYSTFT
ncbi:unnamed protein product [Heligmosomoides polygyrus]|uniref:C2H2-type domain-containing protein n=1 Tax=Heligmosomoides polygyrus TaxID=6339 RepID=A0A183G7I0_HELPZ|nr:unnamed protein product [Heligmosomoides polygyrus]